MFGLLLICPPNFSQNLIFLNTSNIFSLSTEKSWSSSQSLCAHIRTGKVRLLKAQTFKHRVLLSGDLSTKLQPNLDNFKQRRTLMSAGCSRVNNMSLQREQRWRTTFSSFLWAAAIRRHAVTAFSVSVLMGGKIVGRASEPGSEPPAAATVLCCSKLLTFCFPPKDFYRNSRFPTSLKV